MNEKLKIHFAPLSLLPAQTTPVPDVPAPETLVIFAGKDFALGAGTMRIIGEEGAALIKKAAAAVKFKGKAKSALDILAPARIQAARLIAIGVAREANAAEGKQKPKASPAVKPQDFAALGGYVLGRLGEAGKATILFDFADPPENESRAAADFVLGMRLRDYRFDQYKTKKKEDEEPKGHPDITLALGDAPAARREAKKSEAVAGGVLTARSLVNEPANVLSPEEFARRAKALESLGVEVTVLDPPVLRELAMGALLAVGQGSAHESRVVVMRWDGTGAKERARPKESPVAFVGKGVCFDSGGISIKPAAGMEDMKGDMAGAACVMGLIEALALRKASVDAIGIIGLVENMPGPEAQRPGDVIRSMSGQTIEVINTDAEGRLVLADLIWYVQHKFKPKFIVDLATLTGAILVALGQEHAGLFSNDDELAGRLVAAGEAAGEKLWRLPLGPAYDKMIDSKIADMKNTGGRHAGSITAAQFLQRFVNGTPWAHIDIAGTGMGSPASEINQSWGSGFGVRLLNRLIADYYEK
ncbi:MAG: leucyl aminopeptidase [Methylocapsa sp.]|nr:leucyl aminopeptidase [Methylocapsa sp.]